MDLYFQTNQNILGLFLRIVLKKYFSWFILCNCSTHSCKTPKKYSSYYQLSLRSLYKKQLKTFQICSRKYPFSEKKS